MQLRFLENHSVSNGKVGRRGSVRVEMEKERVAIIWAALSSRESLSLERANKDRDSMKKWPIKAKNQNNSLPGENLPDTG